MDKVLIVDDQEAVRTALEVLLDVHGIPSIAASSPAEALDLIRYDDIGVVIQDMNYSKDTTSGQEGAQLFKAIHELDPELPVILITAWTSLETAVELVKAGAADYLAKPWDDQKLVLSVQNLLKLRELAKENSRLRGREERARSDLEKRYDLCGIRYASPAMHQVLSLAVHVAPAEVPVLITGPNGCGKEKVAEVIQRNSRRQNKPFVKVNAGALPDELLEAELFGAEAGAFTGATKLRVGRFEAADGGTLFLDEIGNLSAAGQMKLLRVLQTGEFERVGSSTTRKVNVRTISATNADLRAEIGAGRFREDLYFRLNVIEIEISRLSRRPEDILPLTHYFLERHGAGAAMPELTEDARALLEQHDWPGNVRELENRMQRALLVHQNGRIAATDLGITAAAVDAPRASQAPAPPSSGDAADREALEAALGRARGVVSKAAAELGVSRQALYRRMERHGIELERRTKPVS